MPLTKTVLHNGTIIAGGNSGGIATGLIAGACEVCFLIEATALTGVVSTLELKNALNAVVLRSVYGIAGSLNNHGGYYMLSVANFDSFVLENTGANDMTVKLTVLSTDVQTFLPVQSIINNTRMFTKEELIRLVELNTAKKVISCEPHQFVTANLVGPKSNYIHFGTISFESLTTSITATIGVNLSLDLAQSPNFAAYNELHIRSSYDGITKNKQVSPNVMFNSLVAGATSGGGTYRLFFTGFRLLIQ